MEVKNEFLKNHNLQLKNNSSHVSDFTGYLQFGIVHTSEHEEITYTAEMVKHFVKLVSHENYAYSRQKNGYISIYITDSKSPTGVSCIGGIPNNFEYLLHLFEKTSQLSPTEDLRSAH